MYRRIIGWKDYHELQRIRKEVVVAYFKVLCQYLPGDTDENHEYLSV
jgi:hypothetical protein